MHRDTLTQPRGPASHRSPRPRVTLLACDLATNCFGRVDRLARMLAPEFEISVAGFASGPTWGPAADHGWPELRVPFPRPEWPAVAAAARDLGTRIGGDLLVVCKPWPAVLAVAKAAGAPGRRPALLDVDDWELGWLWPDSWLRLPGRAWRTRRKPDGLIATWRAEAVARRFPHRIASNDFLAERFGGATVIPHAADTEQLNPARVPDRRAARARLGLEERVWVGFVGSPRPHKGLDDLVRAFEFAHHPKLGLLIAGGDQPQASGSSRLRFLPPFPTAELPAVLAAVDIVAIPQRSTPATRGQMPMKLYDAMAMGRPIVATHTCDVATTIDGCGVVIRPGDVRGLAAALVRLADDPMERARLGAAARAKAVATYSLDVVAPRLRAIAWTALGAATQ